MSDFDLPIPVSIRFYEEGDLGGLDLFEVGRYVEKKVNIPCERKEYLYKGATSDQLQKAAERLAKIKVKDPAKRLALGVPLQGEVDYERRRIETPDWKTFGLLYDGVLYQEIISEIIFEENNVFDHCSVVFTNQLFATWDRNDQRYHVRACLYGFPNLISVAGLVEAPAKPKAYYLKKQMGLSVERLREEYRGLFLDHGDSRMTEVLKGYVLQALFFHLSGNPFCEDPDCRFFNSHWQEEVLRTQIDGRYEFCPVHEDILNRLRERRKSQIK